MREIRHAFFTLAFIILLVGILPDRAIDPWGIFNPKTFSYIVLLLSALEFVGYLLSKRIGENKSGYVVGFLGGLVSSTVVTLNAAKNSKNENTSTRNLVGMVIAAQMAAFFELLLVIGSISMTLFFKIVGPIFGAVLVGIGTTYYLVVNKGLHSPSQQMRFKSPLDIVGVLRLSVTLILVLTVVEFVQNSMGTGALYGIAFMTGLFELHSFALATASLFASSKIDTAMAIRVIYIAIIASLISKVLLSLVVRARLRFIVYLTAILFLIAVTLSVLFLVLP